MDEGRDGKQTEQVEKTEEERYCQEGQSGIKEWLEYQDTGVLES